jgi:hypothetical protein
MKSSFVVVVLLLLLAAGLFSRTNDDDAPPLLPLLRLLFFVGIANRGIVPCCILLFLVGVPYVLPLDALHLHHEATARFERCFV